jgi:predicted chitinase
MGEPVLNEDGSVKTITLSQFEELGESIFNLEVDEVVTEKEANYNTFNVELNKAFRNYKIKTCQQKIHFIAQAYHETQRFTSTYETNPSASVIGGPFYRGRGLLHLTHKSNYEELFRVGSGEEPTAERLELFVPTVATSIKVASQAAAWYWNKLNINQYADKDETTKIAAALNYPKALNGVQKDINSINGLAERKLYFNLLKPIFRYDEICKNKK